MTSLAPAPAPAARRDTIVAIVLHWTLAFIILAQIAGGVLMTEMSYSQLKVDLYQWHKSFGLTVLALALVRLVWRLAHRPPPLPAATPLWQARASHAAHIALYALMVGVPLAGWAYVSVTPLGVPTRLFGLVAVPDLPLPRTEWAAELWKLAHKALAIAFLGLIVLHAAAALHHHFRLRDPVLWRMAPWVKTRWRTAPGSAKDA